MKMNEMTKKLYGETGDCSEHDLFRIEEVHGNSVSARNIAETDFDNKVIRIPTFKNLSRTFREKYADVIEGLRYYLFGHEAEVEATRMSQYERRSEDLHSKFEREYLETLRTEGKMLPYVIGLATHNLRLKNGDSTGFSSRIVTYLNEKTRKYADSVKTIEPVVEQALSYA